MRRGERRRARVWFGRASETGPSHPPRLGRTRRRRERRALLADHHTSPYSFSLALRYWGGAGRCWGRARAQDTCIELMDTDIELKSIPPTGGFVVGRVLRAQSGGGSGAVRPSVHPRHLAVNPNSRARRSSHATTVAPRQQNTGTAATTRRRHDAAHAAAVVGADVAGRRLRAARLCRRRGRGGRRLVVIMERRSCSSSLCVLLAR